MMLWMTLAFAETSAEVTVVAGARSAPESAIQVPTSWEGGFEPSGLLAVEAAVEHVSRQGLLVRGGLGAWGYAPDLDASLGHGELGLGWMRTVGGVRLRIEGGADGELFPGIAGANNVRGEVLASARSPAAAPLGGGVTLRGVERAFVGTDDADYSFAELGVDGRWTASPAWTLQAGVGGEVNTPELWGEGLPGAQVRPWVRARWAGGRGFLEGEYRFVGAWGGRLDENERPIFTPLADYADDVDALSGDGFTQHRVSLRGAADLGKWRLAPSVFFRTRAYSVVACADGELEGLCASVDMTQAWGAQLRLDAPGAKAGLRPFLALGVNAADRPAVVDGWGWVGFRWVSEAKGPG